MMMMMKWCHIRRKSSMPSLPMHFHQYHFNIARTRRLRLCGQRRRVCGAQQIRVELSGGVQLCQNTLVRTVLSVQLIHSPQFYWFGPFLISFRQSPPFCAVEGLDFQLFVYFSDSPDRYHIEHSFLGHSNSGVDVIVTIAIS